MLRKMSVKEVIEKFGQKGWAKEWVKAATH